MLAVTRKNKIKEIILEEKSVIIAEMAKRFSVTEETIRRDLKVFEDEGFLIRTYGGAFIQDGVENDINVNIRESAFVENKNRIARKCLTFIKNGDSVFLDASTTALAIANLIKDLRITVLTNSLKITKLIADCENIKLITIGGVYNIKSSSFLGNNTLSILGKYHVDKAFISCRSLDIQNGITDSSEQSAEVRGLMLSKANKVFLIADYSKINKTSFVKIGDFDKVHSLIIDHVLDEVWKEFLSLNNVELYECE
jgi:DeoR/GlpR family transcriptional regulator of sugar metabolism